MSKLQKGPDGRFTLTVNKDIVEGLQWQKGDDIGFAFVDGKSISAKPGDVLLRWNRRSAQYG